VIRHTNLNSYNLRNVSYEAGSRVHQKRTLSPFKKNKMRAVGNLNACGTEGPIPALFRDGRAYPLLLNLLYALSESLARFLRKSLAKSRCIGENLRREREGPKPRFTGLGGALCLRDLNLFRPRLHNYCLSNSEKKNDYIVKRSTTLALLIQTNTPQTLHYAPHTLALRFPFNTPLTLHYAPRPIAFTTNCCTTTTNYLLI